MNLPPISEQTRQKLRNHGFVNRLYDDLKLAECFKPRTLAHQLYTGFIMAASGVGYLICKRGGYISMPFGFAFISAPILALYQKRELDFYQGTANAIIHPKQLAEEFPSLFQQYNKVLGEVEDEISRQKQVLRTLESQKHD